MSEIDYVFPHLFILISVPYLWLPFKYFCDASENDYIVKNVSKIRINIFNHLHY